MSENPQQHLPGLVCLARHFAAGGWVVRLEPAAEPRSGGADLGQVKVWRGGSCPSRYVLRPPSRHQIQVSQQHGSRLLPNPLTGPQLTAPHAFQEHAC